MHIEDAGSQYFHDLFSKSLFQRSNENISQFIMHGLINDLTQSVVRDRCLRLEENNNQYKNWKKTCHLSYILLKRDASMKVDTFTSHKRLQTLLPLDGGFGICSIIDTSHT